MNYKTHEIIPTILCIGGSDPSGGAGLQADLKVASTLDVYAFSVVSAITAQNSIRILDCWGLEKKQLELQLKSILEDFKPGAVKIGLLPSAKSVKIVAEILRDAGVPNIVVDPILSFTLEKKKPDPHFIDALATQLFPLATLVTPNIPEQNEIEEVMNASMQQLCHSFLQKGGHNSGETCTDVLYFREEEDGPNSENSIPPSLNVVSSSPFPTVEPHPFATLSFVDNGVMKNSFHSPVMIQEFSHPAIETENTHGSGCVLSTAIASFLTKGDTLVEAVEKASDFTYKALLNSKDYRLGKGHYGPALLVTDATWLKIAKMAGSMKY